jgi:hypothetical protein
METMADCVVMVTACGEEYPYGPQGWTVSSSHDVRADYRNGHYFDPDTLRWFGSRNFETVAAGASVELQTKAPGDRYRVEIWRADDDRSPVPWFGCRHATRREAVRCARATSAMLWESELAEDI